MRWGVEEPPEKSDDSHDEAEHDHGHGHGHGHGHTTRRS